MSSLVSDIVSFFETQIDVILPTAFTKLKHVYDPTMESRKGADSKFGVRPGLALQNDLNLSSYAVNHQFSIVITNSYKSSKLQNDDDLQDKIIELQDYCHDIFTHLKKVSPGTTQIRHIAELSIDQPEIDTDNSIIMQVMTFNCRYQNTLI